MPSVVVLIGLDGEVLTARVVPTVAAGEKLAASAGRGAAVSSLKADGNSAVVKRTPIGRCSCDQVKDGLLTPNKWQCDVNLEVELEIMKK